MPILRKTPSIAPLRPGYYDGELRDIEYRVLPDGTEVLLWNVTIPHQPAAVVIAQMTSTRFGKRANARKWVEELLDRELSVEEVTNGYDTDELQHVPVSVLVGVAETEDGTFNRIIELHRRT